MWSALSPPGGGYLQQQPTMYPQEGYQYGFQPPPMQGGHHHQQPPIQGQPMPQQEWSSVPSQWIPPHWSTRPPYRMPRSDLAFPTGKHAAFFDKELCGGGVITPVNHGEFESAARLVSEVAAKSDTGSAQRNPVYVVQSCPRGGKTFLLNAVAKLLEAIVEEGPSVDAGNNHNTQLDKQTRVIIVSLNHNDTQWQPHHETALTAILARIAYSIEVNRGETSSFPEFLNRYRDFYDVYRWLSDRRTNVTLLIDDLSVVPPSDDGGPSFADMSLLLDLLAGRQGSAVVYSTHYRSYADVLRGRVGGRGFRLSTRPHEFLAIPRVANELCLDGIVALQPGKTRECCSLWGAVLRGRIPALVLTDLKGISSYSDVSFEREAAERAQHGDKPNSEILEDALQRRIEGLASAITGKTNEWDEKYKWEEFRAYSYTTDRMDSNLQPLYAWPPCILGDPRVLGKDYETLFAALCTPEIDDAEAFEALSELGVLLRLLSSQKHALVPAVPNLSPEQAYRATEMYHVDDQAQNLKALLQRVKTKFLGRCIVKQVVVVPKFSSFPTYDFFVVHRVNETDDWTPAAGYQCKLGKELPSNEQSAWVSVPLSVWIGGSCRSYRVDDKQQRVAHTEKHGWKVLGKDTQFDLLGVSISEALPHRAASMNAPLHANCEAEEHMQSMMGL